MKMLTDRQRDRQDRQADRQTDRETDRQTNAGYKLLFGGDQFMYIVCVCDGKCTVIGTEVLSATLL